MPKNNDQDAKKAALRRELEELEKGIASHIDKMKETEAKLRQKLVD